jgi:predicted MFS family arabinose efflux permease
MAETSVATAPSEAVRRRSIGFINWAHALDHYVILIYPTVVIGLEAVYARTYAELIGLSTAAFVAFGVFSLPAGWLADHWSRRNMMVAFFLGCGASLIMAGVATGPITLAIALFVLGIFAAIYHPVGTSMLIDNATSQGRSMAFNGVCGNLGVAFAAGITAWLAYQFGWRTAFFIPAAVCIVTGVLYLFLVPDEPRKAGARSNSAHVPLAPLVAAAIFALFVVAALAAGLIFHIFTVSLPKIVDERLGADIPLVLIGSIATVVLMCGALAQLSVGRLVEKIPLHVLFAAVGVLQFVGVLWAATATGKMLLVALGVTLAAIYGQVTVNDLVIARYTSDAWRGRAYAVRYFLSFVASGIAVSAIAFLHGRGGFDLLLGTSAAVALVIAVTCAVMALLANGAERDRARAMAPAE